jgi:type III restriction enzyme
LETKGKDSDLVKIKQAYMQEWVKAVNNYGGFGIWHEAISYHPSDLGKILNSFSESR